MVLDAVKESYGNNHSCDAPCTRLSPSSAEFASRMPLLDQDTMLCSAWKERVGGASRPLRSSLVALRTAKARQPMGFPLGPFVSVRAAQCATLAVSQRTCASSTSHDSLMPTHLDLPGCSMHLKISCHSQGASLQKATQESQLAWPPLEGAAHALKLCPVLLVCDRHPYPSGCAASTAQPVIVHAPPPVCKMGSMPPSLPTHFFSESGALAMQCTANLPLFRSAHTYSAHPQQSSTCRGACGAWAGKNNATAHSVTTSQ